MLFKSVSLLALVVSISCFTIPEGLADGLYSVHTDKKGAETHKLLKLNPGPHHHHVKANVSTRALTPSAKFKTRQVSGPYDNDIFCGGYYLNPGDTDAANSVIDRQCGNGAYVGGGYDFYSIAGCTVAYFCNYSQEAGVIYWANWVYTYCYAYERQEAANIINARCGVYGAGWDKFTSFSAWDRVGSYGWENFCNQGKNFCGRGV